MSTYYLAPSTASPAGSDSNAGTLAAPWLTISKFFSVARSAGDTLECRGGSYTSAPIARAGWVNDVQYPNLVGSAGSPVTIRNYGSEVPIFTSVGTQSFIVIGSGCSYVTFDGLQFAASGGSFSFGGWGPGYVNYAVHHITLRRMKITQGSGDAHGHNHLMYFSGGCQYITVEDSVLIAGVTGRTELWHTGLHFYGGDGGYHLPAPKDLLVQRNVFVNWSDNNNPPLVLWDDNNHVLTGSVLHNSFINGTKDIRADRHGAITIRDNATTLASGSSWLYDPYDSAYTTDGVDEHNHWGQTFGADYYLNVGQSGRDAASDGSDAGALDSTPQGPATAARPQAAVIF